MDAKSNTGVAVAFTVAAGCSLPPEQSLTRPAMHPCDAGGWPLSFMCRVRFDLAIGLVPRVR